MGGGWVRREGWAERRWSGPEPGDEGRGEVGWWFGEEGRREGAEGGGGVRRGEVGEVRGQEGGASVDKQGREGRVGRVRRRRRTARDERLSARRRAGGGQPRVPTPLFRSQILLLDRPPPARSPPARPTTLPSSSSRPLPPYHPLHPALNEPTMSASNSTSSNQSSQQPSQVHAQLQSLQGAAYQVRPSSDPDVTGRPVRLAHPRPRADSPRLLSSSLVSGRRLPHRLRSLHHVGQGPPNGGRRRADRRARGQARRRRLGPSRRQALVGGRYGDGRRGQADRGKPAG